MLIDLQEAIASRACAAIDNLRALEIQSALNLTPAAAWTVAMMEADRNGVSSDDIHYESHTECHPFFRKSELMDRLVAQIHERLGSDSTLTEGSTIRLTPLGRLRIRLAMNERIM